MHGVQGVVCSSQITPTSSAEATIYRGEGGLSFSFANTSIRYDTLNPK